jgi:GNAT superfamily N-acetyltransferase
MPASEDVAARALAWRRGVHAAVCDVQRPWAHGTVVRATHLPNYWDFNVVRVEEDPGMGVDDLAAVADAELDGLAHRRIDFDDAAVAEPLRAGFAAAGWRALRLVWMRHEQPPPPLGPDVAVEEVPYDAVQELRVAWHEEDFPGQDTGGYHAQAKEVALARNVQVLTVREAGRPVAFAHIERDGGAAEVTQVYVHPDVRGGGRGTAMTRAAILAAGDVRDLWIAADDEDRPKELYARLGFRPALTSLEVTRMPQG